MTDVVAGWQPVARRFGWSASVRFSGARLWSLCGSGGLTVAAFLWFSRDPSGNLPPWAEIRIGTATLPAERPAGPPAIWAR
jgi:hypothetical protein